MFEQTHIFILNTLKYCKYSTGYDIDRIKTYYTIAEIAPAGYRIVNRQQLKESFNEVALNIFAYANSSFFNNRCHISPIR